MKNLREKIDGIIEDSKYYGEIWTGEEEYCTVDIDENKLSDGIENLVKPLENALEEMLDDASIYYSLRPNAFRMTFEEYYKEEIKALKELKEND